MKKIYTHRCNYNVVFDDHNIYQNRNNSSITSTILHFCKLGSLNQALSLLNSTDPEKLTLKPIIYASLLQTCTKTLSFCHGLQFHAHVIKSGVDSDRFVGNSLLSMYFQLSPNICETQKVFDNLLFKDVISWTSMVSGYVHAGKPEKSLELMKSMSESGVETNAFTISAAIKACSDLRLLRHGKCIHALVLIRGFASNFVISSALIDMYGKVKSLKDARKVFDEIPKPDEICWTSIISVFTRNDHFYEALCLFFLMQKSCHGFADEYTFGSVLTACGNMGWSKHGKEIHGQVIAKGISSHVIVGSSLIDMYGKCRLVQDSRSVFDRMIAKNSISWCALLGGYCQNGDYDEVLGLFREMKKEDHYSFGTVLRACAGLMAVRQGKEIHCQFLRTGGWKDVIVESALVDLYAKTGNIDYAQKLFLNIPFRNLITWNAMICGFAQNGKGHEALKLFKDMVEKGIVPDYITFIGILFACSHTGLVDEGRKYFSSMTDDYDIRPGLEHYTCMVDLLGRFGQLEEAEDLIIRAEFVNDPSLWVPLLGACMTYTNPSIAERVAKKMIKLKPDYHLSYVLLANIYRSVGKWDKALKIRKLMLKKGIKKMPGKSWIEIQSNDNEYQTIDI